MNRRFLCFFVCLFLLAGAILPGLAESPLDSYATGSFGSKQNFPVYSGPGENYVRANNGKAAYGGGTARIFGVCGDWVMIGYGLSGGGYRIGYLSGAALKKLENVKGQVKELAFENRLAYADNYCRLTDDPIMKQKMIYTIPQGTAVTVLSTMGKAWTYVEVETPAGPMRGFVWSIHLIDAGGALISNPTPIPVPSYVPVIAPTAPVTAAPVSQAAPAYGETTYYHDAVKGDWLPAYQECTLEGSWPVYSGPGEYYYRANGGKALMGGGNCRVYGVENGWALIGYTLSSGSYRFGYISADALAGAKLRVPYLDLRYTTRRLALEANLTDDALRYRPTLAVLPQGAYVLFLGYLYESGETWAYVEALADNTIMRGFIPASALE